MPSGKEGIFISTLMADFHKNLHRFTLFMSVCTFFLLIAGGMVTSTGSGLAVPDWPLSYGKLMPPMIGGIFYEHGHRMVASFVGLLTVIVTVWIVKVERRQWVKKLAIAALASVILQGLLGGLTVKLMLPTEVSAAHATLAQIFFCMVSSVALFTSPWWLSREESLKNPAPGSLPTMRASIVLVIVVFVQLILGAVVRHTQSALAIPDFPLAYGQILPSLTQESLKSYNATLIRENVRLFADGPVTQTQVLIALLHRVWALVVAALVVWNSAKLWKSRLLDSRFPILGASLLSVLAVQGILGASIVLTRRVPEIATAHQTLGAVLLMASVITVLHMWRVNAGKNTWRNRVEEDVLDTKNSYVSI